MSPTDVSAEPLRAVTWNAWIGQDATDDPGPGDLLDNVLALIKAAEDPHVLALQEVKDWSEPVPGYRRIQAPRDRFPHQEDRSTVLLVRRDVRLLGHGARRALGPWWTGPKHGTPMPPRVFVRATLWHPGAGAVDVVGLHRTRPNWSRDGMAYEGEAAALVDWARDRATRDNQVWLGDWNEPADASGLVRLAAHLDANVHLRGIDGGLVHGLVTAGVRRIPGRFGGDGHRAVHLRLVGRP